MNIFDEQNQDYKAYYLPEGIVLVGSVGEELYVSFSALPWLIEQLRGVAPK